jgi:hypothetical protein
MGKLLIFMGGLLLGAIGAFGGIIYLDTQKPRQDSDMIFAPKNFYDAKENGEFGLVAISGTLTGKGLGYPNNTYAVSCYGRHKACFVSSAEQIGANQIGRMDNPADYPIVKWNDYEVVAQEEISMFGCFRVTITIDRKQQQLLWLEEPINQTKPSCKDADTNIRKYSLEAPPNWKRIMGK